jgi:transcriptional regulator with XRE-family HTH domain
MNEVDFSIDEYPLGERIRYHRERRKMKQAELAKSCGITQGAVSLIEKSQATPSLRVLRQIARVLNVHIARLFVGEDVPVFELQELKKRYKTWESLTPQMRRQFRKVEAYLKSLK